MVITITADVRYDDISHNASLNRFINKVRTYTRIDGDIVAHVSFMHYFSSCYEHLLL